LSSNREIYVQNGDEGHYKIRKCTRAAVLAYFQATIPGVDDDQFRLLPSHGQFAVADDTNTSSLLLNSLSKLGGKQKPLDIFYFEY
jgi:hypothetical protein